MYSTTLEGLRSYIEQSNGVMPPVELNARLESMLYGPEVRLFQYDQPLEFRAFINGLSRRGSVGEVLVLLRRALDLSLRDFSSLVGISHAYISKLEKSHSDPTLKMLYNIADRLNMPRIQLIWLVSGQDIEEEATETYNPDSMF